MGHKLNILAFFVIAGILGSLMAMDTDFAAPATEQPQESHMDADNESRLGTIFLSHTVSPLKKVFSNMYLVCATTFILLGRGFGFYLESFFQSPPVKTSFDSVLIHAP